ncbi:PAS domain-containing protein [Desmonostoc muscorum LEGE 12446]|uniref:PAS domain S-box protein n=1 Tax=Desmonostoc muscorum LEGE 12446 TaxID=1828758 RepID=A0A8J6ZTF7_DESMC|nr:PAS domain S-box protein [Desmonostoc muscorum]MCF2151408.1 PAS domain-containing protein [Desmonostoc muscorum LEGE 12446]
MKTISEIKLETQLPVIITDQQGFVTYINEAFNQVYGWGYEEIIGLPLEVIIPQSLHDSHRLSFSRFIMTEKAKILNHPLLLKTVTKDGIEVESEHFITAEKQGENWFFAATISPL